MSNTSNILFTAYTVIPPLITFGLGVWVGIKFFGEKIPKPPKPYTCPHGQISNLTPYVIRGQKRTLCKYCYNKEGGDNNVLSHDLPSL